MDDEKLREYLREEYKILWSSFDDWDRRCLTIKGLITAGAAAAVALSVQQPVHIFLPVILFVMALVVCVWVLDAQWRSHQHGYLARIMDIEKFFRGEGDAIKPFQIHQRWNEHYRGPVTERSAPTAWPKVRDEFWRSFVVNPYIIIVVGCLILVVVKVCIAPGPFFIPAPAFHDETELHH